MKIEILEEWINSVETSWKEVLNEKYFGLRYGLNFFFCFLAYIGLARFIFHNRHRIGVTIEDPLHQLFNPVDFSIPIFILIYSGILLFIYDFIPRPKTAFHVFRAFLAVFVIRVICIYLFPLAPPPDTIALNDPFVDFVVGFRGEVMNDLFFSGHISDLSFFVFCVKGKYVRSYLIAATVLVALMLVGQKVHYSVDVLIAPFVSYFCYDFFVRRKEIQNVV